ncbi:MAG: hypothetical protein JWM02_1109 [Frankiales bacterium]|nr:hypothetical protein [Frankiales bacterium]
MTRTDSLRGTLVAIDAGTQDRDGSEHLLRAAVDTSTSPVLLACTHFVDAPSQHWAMTLLLEGDVPDGGITAPELADASVVVVQGDDSTRHQGPATWRAGAQAAAEQWLAGSGRAVVFDGWDRLGATVAVDDVPTLSAIEQVVGVAGTPTAGRVLHTRGHVRPERVGGRLLLHVRPFLDEGSVAPFEVPNPTPCCVAHG